MRLLPTVTDIILAISNLPTGTLVRIFNQQNQTLQEMSIVEAVNHLNCHTMELVQIDKKAIVLMGLTGIKYTLTFHKKVLTQIGIESL